MRALKISISFFFTGLFVYWAWDYGVLQIISESFHSIVWLYLVSAALVLLLLQLLRAWRLRLFIGQCAGLPRFSDYAVITAYNFSSVLLPAKLGELTLPMLLKKVYGVNLEEALKVLIQMRFLDMVFAGLLFGFAGWNLARFIIDRQGLVRPSGTSVLIATFVALTVLFLAFLLFRKMLGRIVDFGLNLLKWPRHLAASIIMTSVLILCCHTVATALAATSFGSVFRFSEIVVIVAVALFAFALPFNGVAGVGPYHGVWILAAEFFGKDPALGLAIGTTYHALVVIMLALQVFAAKGISWYLQPAGGPA